MGEQSEWRAYPGDPSSVVGWMVLSFVQELPKAMFWTITTAVLTAACIALTLLVGCFDIFSVSPDWTLTRRKRRAPPSLAYLAPIPSREPWYPARIELSLGGVATGFDDGIATLGDGWLHFEGRRMMFSLPVDDLSAVDGGKGYSTKVGERTISLLPYDRIEDRSNLISAFEVTVRSQRRMSSSPSGTRRLPPLRIHPWGFGKAWSAVAVGGFLIALSVPLFWYAWAVTAYFGAAVALCGVWRAGRGLYDLGRLRLHSSS